MTVSVAPIGQVRPALLDEVAAEIQRQFRCTAAIAPPRDEATAAWDPARRQYSSFILLRELAAARELDGERVLGVTESDLFIPMLTFVFGQAQFEGRVAIVSAARLRQEFYGLAADGDLLRLRLRKEVAHELGHTFGLVHCANPLCIMSLANTIMHVDRKQESFCAACRALLEQVKMRSKEHAK